MARATMGWGALLGLGGVAVIDAVATTGLPILGFMPRLYYIVGAIVIGGIAAFVPSARWRGAGISGLLIGALCVGWLSTLTPRWDTHAGWQNCRLVAGPWHLRSVVPVDIPGCGVLHMCANEARYDVVPLMRATGCSAP